MSSLENFVLALSLLVLGRTGAIGRRAAAAAWLPSPLSAANHDEDKQFDADQDQGQRHHKIARPVMRSSLAFSPWMRW